MRLGIKDHKVIAAFVERRPADSKKLWTDGTRLDELWMGGRDIAEWVHGQRGEQIRLNGPYGLSGQTIHRAIRHHAAPIDMEDFDPTKRRR